MNARIHTDLPELGTAMEGGFFHGVYLLNGQLWGEVSANKAEGDIGGLCWTPKHADLAGAKSDFDGQANTIAMANAGSPLAQAIREKRIGGHDDWYIPARGGQLLQWANLVLPEAEDFETALYWSSTQFGRDDAFGQDFGDGYTGYDVKSWEGGRARAVRRFLIG